jgi:hypothetical protein
MRRKREGLGGIQCWETQGAFKIAAGACGLQIVADNAGEVVYAETLAVKFG